MDSLTGVQFLLRSAWNKSYYSVQHEFPFSVEGPWMPKSTRLVCTQLQNFQTFNISPRYYNDLCSQWLFETLRSCQQGCPYLSNTNIWNIDDPHTYVLYPAVCKLVVRSNEFVGIKLVVTIN